MCPRLIVQYQLANPSKSFNQSQHCISNEWSSRMFEKLPCVDVNHRPQVTFFGPQDEWQKVAGKYKHLYEMDTDIAYEWLHFWVNANH